MHVVQSLAIKASYYVHNVTEYYRAVESPWLRRISYGVYFGPLSLIYVELMDVIEPLLICVYSSKDVDVATAYDC